MSNKKQLETIGKELHLTMLVEYVKILEKRIETLEQQIKTKQPKEVKAGGRQVRFSSPNPYDLNDVAKASRKGRTGGTHG